ncbi:BsuBI/PstI family type II restriction endonuclease [Hydrogenimonas thermophila]|uniref:BsuBI/PstI restriction endonuclease C-terminus n=1 Tax=Hydrogenimonas thermophila TaxID=223786 RepID=A0A1I5LX39_9BACT|nr:BsuBI/PstI family type II restriction endonuclease [Hydrogenimonas thermophila]SFP01743.1 BsuBI/PstI restriction endonuclease C-terminus [Hydrogenimonas thermophila]
MSCLIEAEKLLNDLGIPKKYNNELMRYAFLALLNLKVDSEWQQASNQQLLRLHDIFVYIRKNFGVTYAENSRETLRKNVIRILEQAHIALRNIDDPSRPTNSGKTNYSISNAALKVIQSYGTDEYFQLVKEFIADFGSLSEQFAKKRDIHKIPLVINDREFFLSPGSHNQLQVDIINEFAPRFAQKSKLLYIGDTADKYIYVDTDTLELLGIPISEDDKLQLPDVILYDCKKNWIYLIEAVTTHGPIDQKRINDLETMFKNCFSDKIYITAFPDRKTFRKYTADIAWETEVWIANEPDHMIHFNGDKFMGPYT